MTTVYDAEEQAGEWFDLAALTASELEPFSMQALKAAGWDTATVPEFQLDVPDASEFSGWAGAGNVIHLHPRLLHPWLVLHELAHWLDGRDQHGPRFCGRYLGLVRAGIGAEAAAALLQGFNDHGCEVDLQWGS